MRACIGASWLLRILSTRHKPAAYVSSFENAVSPAGPGTKRSRLGCRISIMTRQRLFGPVPFLETRSRARLRYRNGGMDFRVFISSLSDRAEGTVAGEWNAWLGDFYRLLVY